MLVQKKNSMGNKLKQILEVFPDIPFMIADGYDEAVIGVFREKLVYCTNTVVEKLMETMNEEDAWEYFIYNIEDSYVGEHTPIFIEIF